MWQKILCLLLNVIKDMEQFCDEIMCLLFFEENRPQIRAIRQHLSEVSMHASRLTASVNGNDENFGDRIMIILRQVQEIEAELGRILRRANEFLESQRPQTTHKRRRDGGAGDGDAAPSKRSVK